MDGPYKKMWVHGRIAIGSAKSGTRGILHRVELVVPDSILLRSFFAHERTWTEAGTKKDRTMSEQPAKDERTTSEGRIKEERMTKE